MDRALETAAAHAAAFLDGLPERRVFPDTSLAALRERLATPLADDGVDPATVVAELATGADPGIVATAGPRYFGFVIGGTLPAALGADWLVSTWDQFGLGWLASPAAAVLEEVAADWVLELLGLPASASVGFVTGAQAANTTCLAAARHAVLRRAGWNVERDGLAGAPRILVVAGAEAHVTVFRSLRLLGLGAGTVELVPADGQGRIEADGVAAALAAHSGPAIVCAQAGNVNTGAIDPLDALADACASSGAWLHVDGAFGLWAAASPDLRGLVSGVERADSWGTDAHKWLNVPYDGAMAIVAHPDAHFAAMEMSAPYLEPHAVSHDGPLVPESSRRPRGVPVYAAIRSLGRRGVAELVDRCCAHARAMAQRLGGLPGAEILNDVVLNQVLVRFGDDDATTRSVVEEVQREGTCWLGATVWQGRAAMRVSFSNWRTTADDVERSAAAIAAAAERVGVAV